MSKQGRTKEIILKLISEGNNNLSTISERLNLAPSTVSKHLHDLEENGIIIQKDDTHIKKWKYYDISPAVDAEKIKRDEITVNYKTVTLWAIAILVAISAAGIYIYRGPASSSYIPISITDPPQVPYGTQALYINYSSLSALISYPNGTSTWVTTNSNGRLDLMALINNTEEIGGVNLRPSASVSEIKFNITHASITIDNISYGVQVSSKGVTAEVVNAPIFNSSYNLLLDFSPIITPVYTSNSTGFVLMPSMRAIAVSNPKLYSQIHSPNETEMYPLPGPCRELFDEEDSNMLVSNAALHTSGNTTTFSVSLYNNGTTNAVILGIILYGNGTFMPFMPRQNLTFNYTSDADSGIANTQDSGRSPPPDGGAFPLANKLYLQSSSNVTINGSAAYKVLVGSTSGYIRIHLAQPTENISISAIDPQDYGAADLQNRMFIMTHQNSVSFVVDNGTSLSVPSSLKTAVLEGREVQIGYVLQPKSYVTFTYSGALDVGDLGVVTKLANTSSYKVAAITNYGIIERNFSK